MKLTKIKQWWILTPDPQKKVLLIVLFIAVSLFGYFTLMPLYKAGSKKFAKVESLRVEVRNLEKVSKTIKQQEITSHNELRSLEKIVKQEHLHRSILPTFSTNFNSKNEEVEFLGIKPGKQQKASVNSDGREIPSFIPLEVRFRSDYESIVQYMKYIESLNKPLRVYSLDVVTDPDLEGILNTTISFHLYMHEQKDLLAAEKEIETPKRSIAFLANDNELTFVPKGMQIESGGLRDVTISLTGFIGQKALFGENLYEEGDLIQGWELDRVSSTDGKVVLSKGNKTKIITIGE